MKRGQRQAWRDSRGLVATLALPQPFDLGSFLEGLAAERGRPLELVPVDTVRLVPCGAVLVTDRADYVCYPARTSALHQRHIIFHEVGHLVAGDVDTDGVDVAPFAAQVSPLLPSLSTELVQRVLGRSHYDDPQEQRAEIIATLLAQQAGDAPAQVVPTADLGSGQAALAAMLGDRSPSSGR